MKTRLTSSFFGGSAIVGSVESAYERILGTIEDLRTVKCGLLRRF